MLAMSLRKNANVHKIFKLVAQTNKQNVPGVKSLNFLFTTCTFVNHAMDEGYNLEFFILSSVRSRLGYEET